MLAEFKIPKDHLDEYVNHTVQRLRDAMRYPGLYANNPMGLWELEMKRRKLHDLLFTDAGFDRIKDNPGYSRNDKQAKQYREFESALSRYLEKVAPFKPSEPVS